MSVSTGSRDSARFHGYGCGARSLISCLRKVNVKNLRMEINGSKYKSDVCGGAVFMDSFVMLILNSA